MIEVYGRPDSSAVARVMWMLGELDLPHKRHDWGGAYGGNDDEAYRAMQPAGKIPAVKLPCGNSLWESNAIIRYFAALHPEYGFLPDDLIERAHAEAWMDWSGPFAGAVSVIRKSYKATDATIESVAKETQRVMPTLQILEKQLSSRAYVSGDSLTVSDFALGVWGHRLMRCPSEVSLDSVPHIRRWMAQLTERPAFQTHVAEKVSAGRQALGG